MNQTRTEQLNLARQPAREPEAVLARIQREALQPPPMVMMPPAPRPDAVEAERVRYLLD